MIFLLHIFALTMAAIIVNFCPTGMVPTKEMTSHVPMSASEIIEQVHEAWEIGITVAHLHAREDDGRPSSSAEKYSRIFEGVRKHCPDLVVCASTSGRGGVPFEKRAEVIELRPDMCSLTLGSLNFVSEASVNTPDTIFALANRMKECGVHPELECFDLGMVNYGKVLMKKGLADGPRFWNLLFGNVAGFQPSLLQVGAALTEIPAGDFVGLAGLGRFQLTANAIAVTQGLGVRVGLEDNIWWDEERTKLATNRELLERVHELIKLQGHTLMAAKTFGEHGFYNAQRFSRI